MVINMRDKLVRQDTEKRGILKSTVVGYFAMWVVRQSPYLYPDDLEIGIKEFDNALVFDNSTSFNGEYFIETTCNGLLSAVFKAVAKCGTVMSWNVAKKDNGSSYVFVDRYVTPESDYDIIDVFALSKNIAYGTWMETCYDDGVLRMAR